MSRYQPHRRSAVEIPSQAIQRGFIDGGPDCPGGRQIHLRSPIVLTDDIRGVCAGPPRPCSALGSLRSWGFRDRRDFREQGIPGRGTTSPLLHAGSPRHVATKKRPRGRAKRESGGGRKTVGCGGEEGGTRKDRQAFEAVCCNRHRRLNPKTSFSRPPQSLELGGYSKVLMDSLPT